MKSGIIKTQITNDFILDLYEEAKKIEGEKEKEEAMFIVKYLSTRIGEYLIEPTTNTEKEEQ